MLVDAAGCNDLTGFAVRALRAARGFRGVAAFAGGAAFFALPRAALAVFTGFTPTCAPLSVDGLDFVATGAS